jgi:hypothetical protein
MNGPGKLMTAKKQHKCTGCGKPITPGTVYFLYTYFDKRWMHLKFHSSNCESQLEREENTMEKRYEQIEKEHTFMFETKAVQATKEEIPQYNDVY